jgi:predicted amidohydrolase
MKVMCHIGGVETRQLMSQILDLLRPGDILTHCYSGFPNLAGDFTNIVQDGKLLPAALAAKPVCFGPIADIPAIRSVRRRGQAATAALSRQVPRRLSD